MTESTPRPWVVVPDRLGIFTLDNNGARIVMGGAGDDEKRVCLVSRQAEAKRGYAFNTACPERDSNAALIVRAVNSHETLVEAVKACAVVMSGNATTKDALIVALSLAHAALSRATGDA